MKTKMTIHLLFVITSLLLFSCQEPNTHTEPPYEGPPKDYIISVERAREMYGAYSERRVPIIKKYEDSIDSSTEKFAPTRYAEYDLETVKQYIAFIEHEAKQANVDVKTLRFYLSNYPNSEKFPNGDTVKYPRKNSFFVVPTMAYEGGNVGFSIEEIGGRYTAVPIKNQPNAQKKVENQEQGEMKGELNEASFFKSSAAAVQGGSSSLILNDSHISPPPSGSNDFGENN